MKPHLLRLLRLLVSAALLFWVLKQANLRQIGAMFAQANLWWILAAFVINSLGNVLFGVKWRNWKLLLREMEEGTYAIREMAYPSIYNLIVDPKEEVPELNYLNDTWVDFPLYQVMEDHEASIEADPGAPDP